MKEKPILFGDELVRAILEGRKTETRRPIPDTWRPGIDRPYHTAHPEKAALVCPFGWPGSRLWVRECWALEQLDDGDRVVWRADRGSRWRSDDADIFYLDADYEPTRWRPSIHMPRWASRITLEITGVHIERVHDITEASARAEGVDKAPASPLYAGIASYREGFAVKWSACYGEESWWENPYVWAITFRLVEVAGRKAERAA